jgi:hypothetical protein
MYGAPGREPARGGIGNEPAMKTHRFGQKIKLHSTLAIKHQILTSMLEDEIRAVPTGSAFEPSTSPALASLRRLDV